MHSQAWSSPPMTSHSSSSLQSGLSRMWSGLHHTSRQNLPYPACALSAPSTSFKITALYLQNSRCSSITSLLTYNCLIPHLDPCLAFSISIYPPNPLGITMGHLHWRPGMGHTPSHMELYLSMSFPGPEWPNPHLFVYQCFYISLPRACVNLPSLWHCL